MGFNNIVLLKKTIYYIILYVRFILDCVNSAVTAVIANLNSVLKVSFQGGKGELIFCCEFCLCFDI